MAMVLREYLKSLKLGATEILTASPSQPTLLQSPVAPRARFLEVKSRVIRQFVFATVLLLSALYAAKGLKRGWFPWDEGILAQSAEAVLHGELPHRDYLEIYTGGLSYLNAAAFRLFGTNLASMRYMLFLFFLLWVPAFYYAALRFVSMPVAGAVTLLAVAWSIPNYSAAMPSWYNLFFATFGLAALLRYIETQKRRWLLAAGLCGGISCLFKISGLYFVAGALLFLLFREAVVPKTEVERRREVALFRIFLTATVFLYEALVFLVLRKVANPATYLYFWVPNLAVAAAILWIEFHRAKDRGQRFVSLFRELTPFSVGVVLPIAIFLTRYVLAGNFLQLFRGVSGSVEEHLQYVNSAPSVMNLFRGIPINLLLGFVVFMTGTRIAKAVGVLFFAGIPVVLFLARAHTYVDSVVWGTVWSFLPLVVVVGVVLLAYWSLRGCIDVVEQQQLYLVLSVCATTNLIQFPYTTNSYYCYVVPFAFLSAAAVFSHLQAPRKLALAGALCFCILYIALIVTPGFVENMGREYRPDQQSARLELPRAGGLRVYPRYARTYDDLSAIIKEHAHGKYIYATPNCPEVYFLNGFRDATATLFRTTYDPSEVTQVVMGALREHDVNLVVLNGNPWYSGPISLELRAALEREFPNRATAGPFEVRWKP
ncbi:MAG TPA: hypothetical protein VK302_12145 [Terriglobales bacterium]|nr:hypothetical protein [Terriglobales bacterium]